MSAARRHRTLPASRFYWSVIDVAVLPARHRRSTRHLGLLLEPRLPVPVESVHAVYAPLTGTRRIACAIDRDALDRELDDEVRTLVPSEVPGAIVPDGEGLVRHLNLLVGEYAPDAARRAARQLALVLATLIVVGAAAMVVRGERVAEAHRQAASDRRAAAVELLSSALGRPVDDSDGALAAAEIELSNRIARLGTTRDGAVAGRSVFDAAAATSTILSAWPREQVLVRSIVVARDGVVIDGTVSDPLVPPRVTAALDGLENWSARLADSRQTAGDEWAVSWRLDRRGGGP